ncbi:MAG: hypothetical protein Q6366_008930 [Candidatus Freyarchaeota archaeon]
MISGIFALYFLGKNVSVVASIIHDSDIPEKDILDVFSKEKIEGGTIGNFSRDKYKILYYATAENESKYLLGIILGSKTDHTPFETPLKEEAELLLRKDRVKNLSSNLKESYQSIVRGAMQSIEERISKIDRDREETHRKISSLEQQLKTFYSEEKQLLAELEKGKETDTIIRKIENIIVNQKELEELIEEQKNIEKIFEEKLSNLKNELAKLQAVNIRIPEFTLRQPLEEALEEAKPEEALEEAEPETLKESTSSDILNLMKKLEALSHKQSTLQAELVSAEESTVSVPEATPVHSETIEQVAEPIASRAPSDKTLEREEEATMSDVLAKMVGEVKAAILEYLFWIKKPRTINEISQDLETTAQTIIENAEDLVNQGYACKLSKKNTKEVYLTVCPNCPLQSRCQKGRAINWEQIIHKK